MSSPSAREQFADLVVLDDADIDLMVGSLLIAKEEYPGLSVQDGLSRVDGMAQVLRTLLSPVPDFHNAAWALHHVLFDQMGFRGNQEDFEDPDNSMMNKVLERKLGLPITLSVLYMEVARRVGLHVEGVSFPGHFVVRHRDAEGSSYVDPFHRGRILLREDLLEMLRRVLGAKARLKPEYLEPCSKKAILTRMLTNMKNLYTRRHDFVRAVLAAERLVLLNPNAHHEKRDRGFLYGLTGRRDAAISDLEDYLLLEPQAWDAGRVRRHLRRLVSKKES